MGRVVLGMAGLLAACAAVWGQDAPNGDVSRRTPVVIAVEKAGPAIVNIATEKVMVMRGSTVVAPRGVPDEDWLDDFWRQYPQQHEVKSRSLGSGVLIDKRGYIITNAHVVQRATSIQVALMDKTVYAGKLVSLDQSADLAVIKIDGAKDFPTVQMGNSGAMYIGETVIAVGNPYGYAHTVTTGVLSAKDRAIDLGSDVTIKGLLQTDASINPGNSGGGLLDINGKLIGICEAIRAHAEGIGFAIPVDTIREKMVDLLDFRRVNRTSLGVGLALVASTGPKPVMGLRVQELERGGASEAAGLKVGDVITKVDGSPIEDIVKFEIQMMDKKTGDKVAFEVFRAGDTLQMPVTMGRLPVPDAMDIIKRRTGMTVETLSDEDAVKEGMGHGGLRVTGVTPGTPANNAGLTNGDVIQLFGNYRAQSPEDLAALLSRMPANAKALLIIVRKGYNFYAYMTVR